MEQNQRSCAANVAIFATFTGFICSLAFNYGYFWSYKGGISLLTLTDILNSYSLWVPILLSLVLFGYGFEILNRRIEKGKTEEELVSGSSNPMFTKMFRKFSITILPTIVFFAIFILYLLFGWPYEPFVMGVVIFLIWSRLICWILSCKKLVESTNGILLIGILFIPLLLIPMFFLGLYATKNININKTNAILYTKDFQSQGKPIIFLRSLEKGLLIIGQDNKHLFYSWENVYKIDLTQNAPFRGILCDWFHFKCSDTHHIN